MRVAIHEAVDKADGVVFRCTLSGSAADRLLEVPAWMFDRARCLDPSRLTASPFVSMDALSVLSVLLRQALKPPLSSSNEAQEPVRIYHLPNEQCDILFQRVTTPQKLAA